MRKKNILIIVSILMVALLTGVISVRAALPRPLADLGLKMQDLPKNAQLMTSGEFADGATTDKSLFGMQNEQGQELVRGYSRGYTFQAHDLDSNAVVINYVYEFASPKEANAELERLKSEIASAGTATEISTPNGAKAVQITASSSTEGTPIYWQIGVKNKYLTVLVVDGLGDKGANSAKGKAKFSDLSKVLLERE